MPSPCTPAQTDTLRSLAHGSIGANYVAVGTAFGHSVRMMRIINNTDGDMIFSDDGVTNKWFVPAGSFVLYDYSANAYAFDGGGLAYPQGVTIYVKQATAPTIKSVYVECTYLRGQ